MKLYFLGTNHFDPLCREKLRSKLQELKNNNDSPPTFIAPEWSEELYTQVKNQRKRFRELVKAEWSYVSEDLLDILEESIGYEADSHLDIFPGVKLIWLDDGRDEDVSEYAKQRINVYKNFLNGKQIPENTTEALNLFSKSAWQQAGSAESGGSRDIFLMNNLTKCIEETDQVHAWGIIIVGNDHATQAEDTMIMLLTELGFECEAFKLN